MSNSRDKLLKKNGMLNKSSRMGNKGQVNLVGAAALALIFAMGIAAVSIVIFSVVAGQTFQSSEATLTAIVDPTVEATAYRASRAGFTALATTGDFLPVFVGLGVLAVVVLIFYGRGGGPGGGVSGGAL